MKSFWLIFFSVFIAELGDKTQLSTLLFASDARTGKWTVFTAASLALVAASALGVLGGRLLGRWVEPKHLNIVAGAGFIAIGGWILFRALHTGAG